MFNIKLTINSIIKVEQLLDKPFGDIDFSNEKDLMSLLYCVVLSNNDEAFTYDEFLGICENKKLFKKMMLAFEKESKAISQFQKKTEKETVETDQEPAFIKDLVSMLILEGLDIDYVLNRMSINDISMYVEAYERKKKETLESQRLWTYISILPHIDGKKIKSPQDLYPFPWEMEEIKEREEREFEEGEKMFKRFMNGEIKFNHGK